MKNMAFDVSILVMTEDALTACYRLLVANFWWMHRLFNEIPTAERIRNVSILVMMEYGKAFSLTIKSIV